MVPGAFSLTIDHEQTRVATYPVSAIVKGLMWNGGIYEDTWIDPVTNTLMLRPMCKYVEWGGTNTGIFARPAIGAYEFNNSGNWAAKEQVVGAGEFMATATSGEWARTASAPGKNRGVNVAFFGYGAGELGVLAYFGWDNTDLTYNGSIIGGVVYSDGTVQIYKGGEFVAEGKIGLTLSGAKNVPIEFMLLPMRRRELLVLGAGNEGFRCVFDDIEESNTNPTITPNEKFWFKPVSTATRCEVQIAPLKFESSGYANSVLVNFPIPPASGATARAWGNPVFTGITSANLYGDKSYSGTDDVSAVALVESDGSTAFVPDGSLNSGRIKVTLSSDGSYTSFVYGAVYEFNGSTALTDDSEADVIDDYITGMTLEVADDPWGMRLMVTAKQPETLESTFAKLMTVGGRPAKLECDGLLMFDGRLGEPKTTYSIVDEAQVVEFILEPATAMLKSFRFRDEYPLDGFLLSQPVGSGASAVKQVADFAGLPSTYLQLTNETYLLPDIPGETSDKFAYTIPIGDDAQQAIESLHSNFAADWFIGMRWTATVPKLYFVDQADLGTTPKMTLYRTVGAALAASKPATQVYRSLRREMEEVAATQVWVTGQDPRTGEVVQSYAIDTAAEDATTAPSSRPDNWAGEPRIYGVSDTRLRRLEDCERLVGLLSPAVLSKRQFGEFSTPEMCWYDSDGMGTMLPLQRGDYVTLEDYGSVQITAMTVEFVINNGTVVSTEARYSFGGLTNAGGVTVEQIQAENRRRYEQRFNDFWSVGRGLVATRVRRSVVP